MRAVIFSYFDNIYQSGGAQDADFFDQIPKKVTEGQNISLLKPFEPDEVKAALFSMYPDKAPGPDGMNPGFYQHFWNDIGSDVSSFILQCLNSTSFPTELNDATIVLIPKISSPETPADLRPITLCNVLYKIMGKMIANRMMEMLKDIISESQSAFIPDRLITDNILITTEAGHYLRRKQGGRVGWAGLKLDMAKAYDRMEWDFLRRMIVALGFDSKWIDLVMYCVTTVRYKVLVNGKLTETIIPSRGIRQGDPLSPYLFIICVEGLSLLLQREENRGRISGLKVARRAPAVSHLFFADDSLLFFKATITKATVIKEVLKKYEE